MVKWIINLWKKLWSKKEPKPEPKPEPSKWRNDYQDEYKKARAELALNRGSELNSIMKTMSRNDRPYRKPFVRKSHYDRPVYGHGDDILEEALEEAAEAAVERAFDSGEVYQCHTPPSSYSNDDSYSSGYSSSSDSCSSSSFSSGDSYGGSD